MKLKALFKCFDTISQHWFFCYAYSHQQATILLRNQVLAINGKYNIQQIMKVIK